MLCVKKCLVSIHVEFQFKLSGSAFAMSVSTGTWAAFQWLTVFSIETTGRVLDLPAQRRDKPKARMMFVCAISSIITIRKMHNKP